MSETLEEKRLREVRQLVDQLNASEAHTAGLKARLNALLGAPAAHGADDDDDDDDDDDETDQEEGDGAATSQRSRVLAVFERQAGKKVLIDDVVKELSDISPNLVRSYASRFTKTGPLIRVKRGVYKYEPETEE